MLFIWDVDGELYTESEAMEIAHEEIDEADMKEVLSQEFGFNWILKNLTDKAKNRVIAVTTIRYFIENFIGLDEDEVEE